MRILVAEDEKIKRVTLARDLAAQGHEVATANDGAEALEKLAAGRYDVVVADLKMPKVDGIDLLKRIKREQITDAEVIIVTAYGSIPLAVEAGKLGAFDFLTKPFRNEDIFPLLSRIETARRGTAHVEPEPLGKAIENIDQAVIGQTAEIGRVRRLVEICARSDANVLLCGETGVGKDLMAWTIHRNSQRRAFPFVKVGCTLFPSQLIESELYGHEKGAFTGAERRHPGRFELAEGGTLYLDDVDDTPLEHQAKLLRAIEEKVYERVGGQTTIRANVRIVASTKRDLFEKIKSGTFRQDLYYRLDVMRVNIPPLRERREDIPLLAEHILGRIAGEGREHDQVHPARNSPEEACTQNQPEPFLSAGAVEVLKRHDWPGNIRELFHVLQRAYLIGAGTITADLLLAELGESAGIKPVPSGPFQETIQKTERELLEQALQSSGGNKSAAATALGMKLSTFRDKIAKHGLG